MTAGRPRAFDYDDALDSAMRVFWSKGFEGTSMPDLTEAMGMNRPSIYAAFGNKEELFCKAMERYAESASTQINALLDAPTIRESIERFLLGSADMFSSRRNPRGCMAVKSAMVNGDEAPLVHKEAQKGREIAMKALRARLDKAAAEGELSADKNTADLARFFTTVLQGMSVQSVGGVSCNDLKSMAQCALKALD